ncbi:MAG: radical SAM protein [Clostridia bacterium]|nr:radical SAM protein [Clostridia bacterium]
MITECKLCPRECKTLRTDNQNNGFCKLPDKIYLAHYGLHFYEEPIISGKNGSGTIFFSGCNLRCEYCQNHSISKSLCGKEFSVQEFVNIIKKLENEYKAENINLVTPTPYSHKIIEALKIYKPKIPIVYNTSGYEKPEVIKELLPYIDIFLTDFKYGDDELAKKYSHVNNYTYFATESLKIMLQKPLIIKDDIMQSGVICRHLVLPNHLDNTKKVFEILKTLNVNLVSVMAQFTPIDNPNCDLDRVLTRREYNKILDMLLNYDFDGFVQEKESYGKHYVPDFNLIKK